MPRIAHVRGGSVRIKRSRAKFRARARIFDSSSAYNFHIARFPVRASFRESSHDSVTVACVRVVGVVICLVYYTII